MAYLTFEIDYRNDTKGCGNNNVKYHLGWVIPYIGKSLAYVYTNSGIVEYLEKIDFI